MTERKDHKQSDKREQTMNTILFRDGKFLGIPPWMLDGKNCIANAIPLILIHSGRENNFDKFRADEIQHLGEPYDYGSIMHYGSKAFSKNGQPTILVLKQGARDNIGQRSKLSDNDIRQINKLYKCPSE